MTKKVIKPLGETMNENFKCHLHIPQPRKGMYVMNIIGQCILEERIYKGKKIPREHQNVNTPNRNT